MKKTVDIDIKKKSSPTDVVTKNVKDVINIKAPTKNIMKWLKRSMMEIIIVSSHQLFIVTVSGAIMYLILYFQTRESELYNTNLATEDDFDIGRDSLFMAKSL